MLSALGGQSFPEAMQSENINKLLTRSSTSIVDAILKSVEHAPKHEKRTEIHQLRISASLTFEVLYRLLIIR